MSIRTAARKYLWVVLALVVFAAPQLVSASDYSAWVNECERRNLLQGCNCDCRKDWPLAVAVPDVVGLRMCKEGQPTGSNCSDISKSDTAAFNTVSGKLQSPASIDPTDTNATRALTVFPNLENGVIQYFDDGTVYVEGTIRNFVMLMLILIGAAAIATAFLGYFTQSRAMGDDDEVERGRKMFTNSLLGFIIAVISFVLVGILTSVTGFGTSRSIDQIVYGRNALQITDAAAICLVGGTPGMNWPNCDQGTNVIKCYQRGILGTAADCTDGQAVQGDFGKLTAPGAQAAWCYLARTTPTACAPFVLPTRQDCVLKQNNPYASCP